MDRESNGLDASARWEAVLNRDRGADGRFVYAVRSTGIYCRPTCPSRRPRREQADFYDTPAAAERAGYRACLRCRPAERAQPLEKQVCRYIDENLDGALDLTTLGERFGLSASHLQRTFKRAMGVSPREYAESRRIERLKGRLKDGESVTEALYGAGYGSGRRLYESSAARLGMTPAAYRRGGRGTCIHYATAACSAGRLLVAASERGLCAVSLGEDESGLVQALQDEYPAAEVAEDVDGLRREVEAVLRHLGGEALSADLPLDVRATAFQWRVWKELQAIPRGQTRSYREIAERIGQPKAVRAVARACASNRVALVIPCHRVIREDGALGGFRWGIERKRALLEREKGA